MSVSLSKIGPRRTFLVWYGRSEMSHKNNKPENPFQNYDVAKKYKKAMRQNVYKILKGTIEKPF